jgi:tetratricopeptide (TPR) repeat protein
MLDYILPPIIIVIGVSALIMFLFRKAKQIPQQEFAVQSEVKQEEKRTSKIIYGIGQFGLKILERMMHKLKLLSLKFHNVSDNLVHSIHEKRQQRKNIKQQESVEQKKIEEEKAVEQESPQPIRPLIRETATHPIIKNKEKNQLEEVLIKRIAINPKDIEAYERLGDYYLESENYQDSKECFKQVLKLSPMHYKARLKIRKLEKLIS